MNLDDIEIKVVKYDDKRGVVIVNICVARLWEMRGFVVRYTSTKRSQYPVWIVNPPSVRGRGVKKYFHVVRCKDSALWQQLEGQITKVAQEHTKLL